ncbi:pyrroline-5-carboxylate reductase [Euzebya tangerina]|uniref:pyrroline-5-carboxylate reductase n=1 Tax=Euzebya tangerina TaxID=591198 RepID=UPI000E31A8C9|nr:pyrroline-5-carboxylate reductase [Euzebya tangerina]
MTAHESASTGIEGKIGILGAGRLGEALLSGLLRSGAAEPDQIRATVRHEAKAAELSERHNIAVSTDSAEVADWADIVVVAVKPQSLDTLLWQVAGRIHPGEPVISVVAGVPTTRFEEALGEVPVVRVMTNVPVLVDEAMSAIAAGTHASEKDLGLAEDFLRQVGRVVRLAEGDLDAVTALSGSGPAYFFLLAEAMIDAGILLGLPRDVATELIIQTMMGSALMLRDTGRHPVELRESVTSPGGTTIAAVRVLEEQRVRAAFLNAIEAAKNRSVELGR